MIDLEPRAFGARSLRGTKVALVYKKTGNLRACQLLLRKRVSNAFRLTMRSPMT
jgi:hypothetical protein